MELWTQDYELLERYNVQWLCCKCESINVSTFTFRVTNWNYQTYTNQFLTKSLPRVHTICI
jgi:hypothetical protein